MPIDSARAFLMQMKEDEAFRKSVIEAGQREKALELAKTAGYHFTLDEIRQVRKEEMAKLREAGMLKDEDLEKVASAGGGGIVIPGGCGGGGVGGWCMEQ